MHGAEATGEELKTQAGRLDPGQRLLGEVLHTNRGCWVKSYTRTEAVG